VARTGAVVVLAFPRSGRIQQRARYLTAVRARCVVSQSAERDSCDGYALWRDGDARNLNKIGVKTRPAEGAPMECPRWSARDLIDGHYLLACKDKARLIYPLLQTRRPFCSSWMPLCLRWKPSLHRNTINCIASACHRGRRSDLNSVEQV